MQSHEYRVVPAPKRGVRAKGVRRAEDRFARAVEAEMNRMAAEGWEFVRSDTLPQEITGGWFRKAATVFQTVLVFRRTPAQEDDHDTAPRPALPAAMPPSVAPVTIAPNPAPAAAPPPVSAPPAAMPPPPAVAAPAASRFTPPPLGLRPANDAAPVAMPPPPPSITLVEPPAEPPPKPRRAAE